MAFLKDMYQKYREPFLYLVSGGLTTVINYFAYFAWAFLMGDSPYRTVSSTVVAWIVAVVFAYLTNRIWVFRSQARGARGVLREVAAFFAARVFSLVVEVGIMYSAVDILGFHELVVKVCASVIVVLLNYVLSKLFIFRKG